MKEVGRAKKVGERWGRNEVRGNQYDFWYDLRRIAKARFV